MLSEQAILSPPRPLLEVPSLLGLLDRLHRYDSRVPLDALHDFLERHDFPFAELKPLCRFNRESYARNRLYSTAAYEALLVCWRPGQKSPIHDHKGSSCAFRVLSGVCSESLFDLEPDGRLRLSGACQHAAGAVCSSEDADIHQVANDQPGEDLVTLHIYSPPLRGMTLYAEDGPPRRCGYTPLSSPISDDRFGAD